MTCSAVLMKFRVRLIGRHAGRAESFNGFYINTPMGKYNPDWAVAFREGSVKHVYFVAESKGDDLQGSQLRGSEESKIECARRHFKAISDNGYIYDVAKDYKSLYDIVTK